MVAKFRATSPFAAFARLQMCKQLTCYSCKTVICAANYPTLDADIRSWHAKLMQKPRVRQGQIVAASSPSLPDAAA